MPKTDVEIAQAGSYMGHWQGPYELTDDDLQRMVDNMAGEVVIDYEHNTHNPDMEMARAAGWVQRLWVEGSSLWGEVEWTDRAAEMIDQGEYRYLSPVIDLDALDKETGNPIGARLISVGLVNTPFMDDMESVQQNDGIGRTAPVHHSIIQNSFRTTRTNSDRPMENDSKLKAFLNRAASVVGLGSDADELDVLDETRQLRQNAEQVETLKEERDALQNKVSDLESTVSELKEKLQNTEVEQGKALVNSAVEDYRIKKSEREKYLKEMQENPDQTKAILNALPKGVHKPDGKGVDKPSDGGADDTTTFTNSTASNGFLKYASGAE